MRPRRHAPGGYGPAVEQWASKRRPYLDNLKVLLIAAIIAIHGVLGYSTFEAWTYSPVREVTLSPVSEVAFFVLAGPFGLFLIALLFLVAGLLTTGSLARKGPAGFARDRLLRLGVPFAVFVLLLQPLLAYALYHPLGEAPGSYWGEFLDAEGNLDTGPLWFVGVLLILSLVYAGWARVRRKHPRRHRVADVSAWHLVSLAACLAVATFLVRLVYPAASESFTDLNLWEWPACVALFGLGIVTSRLGWLDAVPDQLRQHCRAATVAGLVAAPAVAFSAGALGRFEDMLGGWNGLALAFAMSESTLNVFGSVWLLSVAQRRLDRRTRLGPVLSRSAYAAFMLQGLVLIGLAVVMRSVPWPAEIKALVVAGGGVAGSFALAWLLISRVPVVARIL
jgi:hypothetical protein